MIKKDIIWKILFWSYLLILFIVVVIKFDGSFSAIFDRIATNKASSINGFYNPNYIPFRTIRHQLKHFSDWWAMLNIIGNTIAFIPFGFLLPFAYKNLKVFWKVLLIGVLSTTSIEVFQLLTFVGYFDIDDMILNTIGVILGYIIYIVFNKYITKI